MANISLQHILADIDTLGELQYAVEPLVDSDLGYRMGGHRYLSTSYRYLCKDLPIKVSALQVTSLGTGFLKSNASGVVSIESLPDTLYPDTLYYNVVTPESHTARMFGDEEEITIQRKFNFADYTDITFATLGSEDFLQADNWYFGVWNGGASDKDIFIEDRSTLGLSTVHMHLGSFRNADVTGDFIADVNIRAEDLVFKNPSGEFRVRQDVNSISTLSGVDENTIGAASVTVTMFGGTDAFPHSIGTTSYLTVMCGGYDNTIGNNSIASTICGGAHHIMGNVTTHGFIGGGSFHSLLGDYCTVCGGTNNDALASYAVVCGGSNNTASGTNSFVGGGDSNNATFTTAAVISGGNNTASALRAVVIGGTVSVASGDDSLVSGNNNSGLGDRCVVIGGQSNTANANNAGIFAGSSNFTYGLSSFVTGNGNTVGSSGLTYGDYSSVTGGLTNALGTGGTSRFSCIAGGRNNTLLGEYSIILGGHNNTTSNNYTLAAGRKSQSSAQGAFTMSDSQDVVFNNATSDRFALSFQSGYYYLDGWSTYENPTAGDTEGARRSRLIFKGKQSGLEVTTLSILDVTHSGISDDEKGKVVWLINDGSDADTPTETIRMTTEGLSIKTLATPTAALDINGDVIRLRTSKTVATQTASGNTGDRAWDSDYLYQCVASNNWRRTPLYDYTTGPYVPEYGNIWIEDNGVATTIATVDVWVQVDVFAVNAPSSSNITPDYTNDHITVDVAGTYLVSFSASFSGAAANQTYEIEARYDNGVNRIRNSHCDRRVSSSDVGSCSGMGIVTLAAASTVELWVKNKTTNANITFEDVSLNVIRVSG